ncbi:hypothetical protein SKUL_40 [Pseudomonas phage Skulduggery]|uniref:Uncharacterized protein n=1 Tax=Pseudomonas phage Skulduggery TaxID=2006671 RepID=A0A1Y0T023_9CAUD|nr:hypothetical protein PP627_gp40 [Pseudomonas phage Skulduggery]ARV77139.1 hypothetical protein SKUL_40 [Pseudomonas phage Skulduggery]
MTQATDPIAAQLGIEEIVAAPICHYGTPKQLAALYGALALAQGEFEVLVKNRTVTIEMRNPDTRQKIGEYNFRYADLEQVTKSTRPALSKHGLGVIQPIAPSPMGGTAIFTQLFHKDGGMIISEVALPTGQKDIKNLGASISYLRRYAKTALLDLAADDDADQEPSADSVTAAENANSSAARGGSSTSDGGSTSTTATTGNVTDGGQKENHYSDAEFEKNLPGYIAAMKKGRTLDQMLKTINTRKKLTEAQTLILTNNNPNREDHQQQLDSEE